MRNFYLQKGPHLLVVFHTNSSTIVKIQLKLASRFEVKIQGEASNHLCDAVFGWIQAYLNPSKNLPRLLPLAFPSLSLYQREVLEALSIVPFGTYLSYQRLASKTSSENAARAVGSICKNNPFPLVIPCHRVIRSDAKIGQFNGGVEIKKRLLAFEGALHHIKCD